MNGDEVAQLLREIISELHAIREVLESQSEYEEQEDEGDDYDEDDEDEDEE